GEWERAKGEARLLDSTVGSVVPLLPVSPARTKSELKASVERLFDEGAAGGGHDAEIESSTGVRIIAAKNVTVERPKRSRKKRQAVTDAGGSSHPPKKLRGDYGTFDEAATSGKSPSVLKELLASSMLNVEAGVAAMTTLPMVTSSVSATPEHESGVLAVSITGLNLCTIGASERSAMVPLVMTEAVTTSRAVNAPSVPELSTKVPTLVHASMFHDSDSMETVKVDTA
ncbi:hypothetical protein Tco_1205178, partial [Tanacetum coccineum]